MCVGVFVCVRGCVSVRVCVSLGSVRCYPSLAVRRRRLPLPLARVAAAIVTDRLVRRDGLHVTAFFLHNQHILTPKRQPHLTIRLTVNSQYSFSFIIYFRFMVIMKYSVLCDDGDIVIEQKNRKKIIIANV